MHKNVFRFQEFPVYKEARQFRKELKQLSQKNFQRKNNSV